MISDVEAYFTKGCGRCARFGTRDCATQIWADGLCALRAVCLETGLAETVKWGHPCYMFAGRNIAVIGAFREDFRLSFFNAALLRDHQGVLERQGANTAHPDTIRFRSSGQVATQAVTVQAYLREAMGYAEAGIKPPKTETAVDLPDEMIEAMETDPEMANAFWDLTTGRQKSYALHLASAKKPATLMARIDRIRPKILSGKGFNER